MNVLICEDDIDIQDLLEIIILDMGLNLFQCRDKDSLYKEINSQEINLIILDYWLKKKKADEILSELKKEHPEIPVILMSAIADLPEISKKLKADDYIKKPFNIEELKDKIKKHLKI